MHPASDEHPAPRGFHVMTKPIGPLCNLDCKYCFYLEKTSLYPETRDFRMSEEVLESYVRQYIEAQDVPEISFAWQGGEPTLLGVPFFRKVVELQRKFCPPNKRILNAFQTNGTLLDDEWCAFLAENDFLIGLSVDGPRDLHDRYRVDHMARPSLDQVMRAAALLKQHDVAFNTLTVVHRYNVERPLEVYRFLKEHGSGYMQFIPLVERVGQGAALAGPPDLSADEHSSPVTPWSVPSAAYGDFLCAVFDEWVRRDVGEVFVQIFDVQLGIWAGLPSSLCVFGETCGRSLALEHNGDLYSCDHFVYPQFHVGNILERPLVELVYSPFQKQFGQDKQDTLPRYCRECEFRFACNGECPKHRFVRTPDGEPGLNYLCRGYKRFFRHIAPYMEAMADLLRAGRPAADIMRLLTEREGRERRQALWAAARRNDPCPCGSGRKVKNCCWAKART
jgi:uncharacterized protein